VATVPPTKSQQPFYVLLSLVIITACLYWARQVLIPVALAVLLSFILTPAVSALQRRGLGRLSSVLVVVILALVLLGGAGYLISRQIEHLVGNLPNYQANITRKIESLRGSGTEGFWGRIQSTWDDISRQVEDTTAKGDPATDSDKPGENPDKRLYVQLAPSGWTWAAEALGPAAEGLASAFLVLVLTVFMLSQRENLRNRVVRLMGHGRLIATTQAIDEGAQRVSRFLIMQVSVNAVFGVALAAGLVAVGLWTMSSNRSAGADLCRYALLWGFVAGALRFVPYLGTWLAAALVMAFSVAILPTWAPVLGLFVFFVVIELLTANVIEPLVFGHSTGISPVALLLAAAFWTWLWGPVGLILSTPLTVILVVLGKYVPQLDFFAVLLGDEPALSTDVTFYQRLVARDLDEASDLIDDYLQGHPAEAVYEDVLLPALLLAKKDRDREELDGDTYQFVLGAMHHILEDMASAQAAVRSAAGEAAEAPRAVALGCPGRDEADELALDIFAQYLRQAGYTLEVVSANVLSAEVMARVAGACPRVVCVGSLPPGGLAQARYLCKRLRLQCPDVKLVVGRWGEKEDLERLEKRLRLAGADHVGTTLQESRTQLVPMLQVAAAATPSAETGIQTTAAAPAGSTP
jgi:predicted PurR-regulated permease PerM